MELTEQVTNLKLSQKLEELGCKQDSLFYWMEQREGWGDCLAPWGEAELRITPHIASSKTTPECPRHKDSQYSKHYSAFTVAELGEMLPYSIKSYIGENYIRSYDEFDYVYLDRDRDVHYYFGRKIYNNWDDEKDIEANGRAEMLILTIENGHMKEKA